MTQILYPPLDLQQGPPAVPGGAGAGMGHTGDVLGDSRVTSCACSGTPGAASSRSKCQSRSHRSPKLLVMLCSATNPPKTPTRALAQPKPAWMSSNPAADSELRVDKCQKGPLSSRLPGPAVTSSVLASAPMTRGGGAEQFWLGFFFGEDSSSSVLKDLKGGESATSLGKVIALPIKNL